MAKVVAVMKESSTGNLIGFKLDDGRILDQMECAAAIHNGELPDLICTNGKNGALSIRTYGDGKPENNLSNLPLF